MRHAEGKPLGLVRSPSPMLKPLPRGWGVAPSARSTPTRSAARDTPKNEIIF
ncbi:MAG: hypothetical protein NZ455_08950 [Bacteroidia bacterium]|nr:hypothetical protein [Bacteroidia bacterium]